MGGILLKIRTWWETADRTQRVVTVFGSSFLVMLLIATAMYASRPKMALAYGGLTPADQGKVVAEIQKLGIPVEYDLVGNVRVPSDRVAEAQAMLAKNGVAPTSGHLGASDRGAIGMMSPKGVEDAQLNAIREGEIAQTLEALNGVSSAKVLLNSGEKSAFASEDDPPSASVTISEDPGADLSGSTAKSMASLVAKAVPGLTVKNVTIVNQDGVSLFDGMEAEGSSAAFSSKVQAQNNEARRIKRELQPLLDRFGVGATVLTVRVEMDFDKRTEHTYAKEAAKEPLTRETATEEMSGGASSGSGGASGVTGNLGAPGIGDSTQSNSPSYKNNRSIAQYPFTETRTETEKAPGTVKKLTISVLADSEKIKDVAAVKKALEGYLPADKVASEAFRVTVTPTKFDATATTALAGAGNAAAGRERTQQIFSLLPIGALLLVAFMIIKAIGKVAKSQNVLVHALPGGGSIVTSALPVGTPGEGGYEAFELPEVEPPPRPKKKKRTPHGEEEEDDEPMHVRIGRINEKVNVPLEQLKKMTRERPEAVAMLLKSWLVEERR